MGGVKMGIVKNMGRNSLLRTVAVGALVCMPSVAFAQNAEPADAAAESSDGGLDVIVVQARKVNENLQNVPVAVTAFTGDELAKQNFQQLDNLAKFTPGLRMAGGAASPSAAVITLRGQVQTDILAALDPSVGTYVDGVYWARSYGLNSNLLDIESVQVLKGPQGTLFGRNTTGGAILINSKNPDMDDFEGSAAVSYGRFNELEATAVLNLPLVSDAIALRLAGSRTRRDGYTTNIAPSTVRTALGGATFMPHPAVVGPLTGQKYDGRDRWNVRAKLSVRPTETLELLFSGEVFDSNETASARYLSYVPARFVGTARSNYDIGNNASILTGRLLGSPTATAAADGFAALNSVVTTLGSDPNVASLNEAPNNAVRTTTLGLTGSLDVPWGQIKLITAYRRVQSDSILDVDGSPYPLYATGNVQDLKQYSGELQTTGKAFGDKLDFAVGLFYFKERGSDAYTARILSGLLPVYQNSYGFIDNDGMGIYGQGTWHISDALGFTGGIRYSVDDKGLESRNADYVIATGLTSCKLVAVTPYAGPEDPAPAPCAKTARNSFSGISYTLGLDYKLGDNTLLYAKVARGFRAGGHNFRARNSIDFVSFKPEIAMSYEAGIKTEMLDRHVRFNLAAYITNVDDIQRTAIIAVPPVPPATVSSVSTVLGNAGTARFKGFEAELVVKVVDGLTFSGSLGHVSPSYVSFADSTGDRRQERFVQVSNWQYSLAGDYTSNITSNIELSLHADYSWRSKTPSNEYNYSGNPDNAAIIAATTLPAMGLLGARIGLTFDERYEFAVWGRNLTNERGYNGALAVLPLGFIGAWRQEPVTYGLTAKVRF
ncbi:TonB-dependent receptor [Novosphingobium aquae]|uniref:TonB-dependent receptor n=1 Tax=Novosphingobium aquae TaxID=3133435 RepID=A0ABU8S5Y8_9SPHN